jgi:hypothetical protein
MSGIEKTIANRVLLSAPATELLDEFLSDRTSWERGAFLTTLSGIVREEVGRELRSGKHSIAIEALETAEKHGHVIGFLEGSRAGYDEGYKQALNDFGIREE